MTIASGGREPCFLDQRTRNQTESFLAHLEPLQRVLEAYCHRSLRDREEVADVLQAAAAKAFRDFHEFQEGTNFRAWIFRYVSFEVLNRNRSTNWSRTGGLLTDVPAVESAADWIGEQSVASVVLNTPQRLFEGCDDQLAEAIRQMPELERSVFLLRAIGEFQYREIAEILGMPMGTVMSLLSRGRGRLRSNLADYARKLGWLPGQETE